MRALLWILFFGMTMVISAQTPPETVWTRVIAEGGDQSVSVVRAVSFGDYLVAGSTTAGASGGRDMLLLRLDAEGTVFRRLTLGGPGDDEAADVRELPDGGCILVGTLDVGDGRASRVCLARITPWYDTLWTRILSPADTLVARGVVPVSDGGYQIVGRGQRAVGYFYARTDGMGHLWGILREPRVDQPDAYLDSWATDLEATADGFVVARGNEARTYVDPQHPITHRWLSAYRYNPAGELMSYRVYPSVPGSGAAAPTADHGYLVAADFQQVVQIGSGGQWLWTHTLSGPAIGDLRAAQAGNYVTLGTDSTAGNGDFLLRSISTAGTEQWREHYGGSGDECAQALDGTPEQGYILAGTTSQAAGDRDVYLVRTGPCHSEGGYLTLLVNGPPRWGYRLLRWSGEPGTIRIGPVCPGTTARVSAAIAPHWNTTVRDDTAFFEPRGPAPAFSVMDTFWVEHPHCTGTVTWSAFTAGGTLPGAYMPRPEIELFDLRILGGDSGVDLSFQVWGPYAGEWEVWRSLGDTTQFARIADHLPAGSPLWRFRDRTIWSGQTAYYRVGIRDSAGYYTLCCTPPARVLFQIMYLHSFRATDADPDVHLAFTTSGEFRIAEFEIWRSTDDVSNFVRVGSFPARGGPYQVTSYEFVDTTTERHARYWYKPADVSVEGVRTLRHERLIPVQVSFTWISAFTAVLEGRGVRIRFVTPFENRVACFEVWRRQTASAPTLVATLTPHNTPQPSNYTVTDSLVAAGATYEYYAVARDTAGSEIDFSDLTQAVILPPDPAVAYAYRLSAYPNPFNAGTRLAFSVPVPSVVRIQLYDPRGRLVRTLVDAPYEPGAYEVPLAAPDLPSGIYFARLTAGAFVQTQKLLLVR